MDYQFRLAFFCVAILVVLGNKKNEQPPLNKRLFVFYEVRYVVF